MNIGTLLIDIQFHSKIIQPQPNFMVKFGCQSIEL